VVSESASAATWLPGPTKKEIAGPSAAQKLASLGVRARTLRHARRSSRPRGVDSRVQTRTGRGGRSRSVASETLPRAESAAATRGGSRHVLFFGHLPVPAPRGGVLRVRELVLQAA
jgi:hypothetical protein